MIYKGIRLGLGRCEVIVDGQVLDPCFHLRNHSPDGFEFGYGGSGPAQLALAILFNEYKDENFATKYYQRFKWEFVAKLKEDAWTITSNQIRHIMKVIMHKSSDGL